MFMKCQCTDVCHIKQWDEGLFQCSCMADRTLNADGYTCSGEPWVIGNYLPHVRGYLFIQVLWSSDTFYYCLELSLIYYLSMFFLILYQCVRKMLCKDIIPMDGPMGCYFLWGFPNIQSQNVICFFVFWINSSDITKYELLILECFIVDIWSCWSIFVY